MAPPITWTSICQPKSWPTGSRWPEQRSKKSNARAIGTMSWSATSRTVSQHPNADRLSVVTVDHGGGTSEVVCGAPNVAAGQRIAYASVGAHLIDGYSGKPCRLKRAKIRGVVSEGMVCSEKELGLGDSHEGILVLDPDAEIGRPLGDVIGDTILELELTPNRPDCLGIVGVAREVSAFTGADYVNPAPTTLPAMTKLRLWPASSSRIPTCAPDTPRRSSAE